MINSEQETLLVKCAEYGFTGKTALRLLAQYFNVRRRIGTAYRYWRINKVTPKDYRNGVGAMAEPIVQKLCPPELRVHRPRRRKAG